MEEVIGGFAGVFIGIFCLALGWTIAAIYYNDNEALPKGVVVLVMSALVSVAVILLLIWLYQ